MTSNLSQIKISRQKIIFCNSTSFIECENSPLTCRIIEFLLRVLSLSGDSRVCTYLTSSDLCIRSTSRSLRCSKKSTREEKKKKRGVKTSWCYGRHDDGYRSLVSQPPVSCLSFFFSFLYIFIFLFLDSLFFDYFTAFFLPIWTYIYIWINCLYYLLFLLFLITFTIINE